VSEQSEPPEEAPAEDPGPVPHRLDPDAAVAQQRRRSQRRQFPQPVIDTRPYRWAIGIFGIVLVIVISVVEFATHGVSNAGVQPGHPLIQFAAPIATSNLVGDVQMNDPCRFGDFGGRAINTCVLEKRGPLVLGFFVPGVTVCEREVDTLQALSKQFPSVQFVAVAASSSKATTAKEVRSHHWTIPVGYDRDGALAQVYGVELCPMLELAERGGVVRSLLFGENWDKTGRLAAEVSALAGTES
jgi:AhpC/TSA family